jgi:hypothetical protein
MQSLKNEIKNSFTVVFAIGCNPEKKKRRFKPILTRFNEVTKLV